MQEIALNLVIGVIGGVLTTALLYFAAAFFKKVVIPSYLELVYRGVDLTGRWTNEVKFDGTKTTQIIVAEIKQSAHKLTGSVIISKSMQDGTTQMSYSDLDGEIRDRLVRLKLTSKDVRRIGMSIVLLEVYGAGDRMKGFNCWYDVGAGAISSREVEWHRE